MTEASPPCYQAGVMGRQLLFALLLVACTVADTEPEPEREREPACFDDTTTAPSECQPSTCAHVMLNALPKVNVRENITTNFKTTYES